MLSNDATLESPASRANTEKAGKKKRVGDHAIGLHGVCQTVWIEINLFCLV